MGLSCGSCALWAALFVLALLANEVRGESSFPCSQEHKGPCSHFTVLSISSALNTALTAAANSTADVLADVNNPHGPYALEGGFFAFIADVTSEPYSFVAHGKGLTGFNILGRARTAFSLAPTTGDWDSYNYPSNTGDADSRMGFLTRMDGVMIDGEARNIVFGSEYIANALDNILPCDSRYNQMCSWRNAIAVLGNALVPVIISPNDVTLGAVWRTMKEDVEEVYRVGETFSPIFYEAATKVVRAAPDSTWLDQALPAELATAFDAAAAVTGGSWIKFTREGTPYLGYFMTLPNVVGQTYVAGTFWQNTNDLQWSRTDGSASYDSFPSWQNVRFTMGTSVAALLTATTETIQGEFTAMNTPSNGYFQPPGGYYVFVIEYNTGIRRVHADPALVGQPIAPDLLILFRKTGDHAGGSWVDYSNSAGDYKVAFIVNLNVAGNKYIVGSGYSYAEQPPDLPCRGQIGSLVDRDYNCSMHNLEALLGRALTDLELANEPADFYESFYQFSFQANFHIYAEGMPWPGFYLFVIDYLTGSRVAHGAKPDMIGTEIDSILLENFRDGADFYPYGKVTHYKLDGKAKASWTVRFEKYGQKIFIGTGYADKSGKSKETGNTVMIVLIVVAVVLVILVGALVAYYIIKKRKMESAPANYSAFPAN